MPEVPLLLSGVDEVDESLAYCVAYSRRGGGPGWPLGLKVLPRKAVAKGPRHLEMSVGRM